MLTIGFTTEYYTLWEVSEPFKKYTGGVVINGVFSGHYYMVQECIYRQNLSKDYNKAIEKAAAMGEYAIDLDLRGHSSFSRQLGEEQCDLPFTVFSFGQLKGQEIMQATDVWQLNRAMREERGQRRRVYARRRLIELGELVRNTFSGEDRYISPVHYQRLKEKADKAAKGGHFFENGQRLSLQIRRIGGTGYETQYGWVSIEEYELSTGQIVKYKGSSPVDIGMEESVSVMATIEHCEYNGLPETRLKRIKIITPA